MTAIKTQFTKGPWKISVDSGDETIVVAENNRKFSFPMTICKINRGYSVGSNNKHQSDYKQAEGNKALILASPDMLEALVLLKDSLKETEKVVGLTEADKERLKIINAVIKKATTTL